MLKHIFRPDLRERLPEVLALWYTMRQKAHALDYLEAVNFSGIRLALKLKFGMAGVALMSEIAQIEDVGVLQTIEDGIELAATPDELRQLFPTPRPDGGDLSE